MFVANYRVWWHGHSSELIFISQKLFQILWWLHIISFIFFKDFAGKSKFIFNLDSKIWGKFVCFDLTVVVASSSAPEAEFITKNLTRKKFKFGSGLHIPAKNFKEIIKIKSDHHNILNNFCEIKFNLEECPSHHNVYNWKMIGMLLNTY